jgi:hypothetical protein
MPSARRIILRYPANCAVCQTALFAGTEVLWYGRGQVYGLSCHERAGCAGVQIEHLFKRACKSPSSLVELATYFSVNPEIIRLAVSAVPSIKEVRTGVYEWRD